MFKSAKKSEPKVIKLIIEIGFKKLSKQSSAQKDSNCQATASKIMKCPKSDPKSSNCLKNDFKKITILKKCRKAAQKIEN